MRKRKTQEPVAWLRDLDGTGSLHPAAKGDPGAFPVYKKPRANRISAAERRVVEAALEWRQSKPHESADKLFELEARVVDLEALQRAKGGRND